MAGHRIVSQAKVENYLVRTYHLATITMFVFEREKSAPKKGRVSALLILLYPYVGTEYRVENYQQR